MSSRLRSSRKCSIVDQKAKVPKDEPKLVLCNKHVFSGDERDFVQSELLKWYDNNQRKLPWRNIARDEKDLDKRGYAVWVSEIMLQQTQVATVIPYYTKWMKKWPTVKDLAVASLEDVNKTWAGLGYYSRAKKLHEGARVLVDTQDGHMPRLVNDLKNIIPGIGRYTASAISSIAYQTVCGVVDGNVARVLSRIRAIGCDITKQFTQNHLWILADDIVSKSRPGDFNQAIMELGAVICTPRNPKCSECPLKNVCVAYTMVEKSNPKIDSMVKRKTDKASLTEIKICDIENVLDCKMCIAEDVWKANSDISVFPIKPKKKSSRLETVAVVVVEKNSEFLLIQRPETGLLAGLWEFPSVILDVDASDEDQCKSVTSYLSKLGIPNKISSHRQKVGEVLHIFSHIRTTYLVEHLIIENFIENDSNEQKLTWLKKKDVDTSAISTAMKKVLQAVISANNKSSKVPTKKQKISAPEKSQKSIKSFFK